MLAGQHLVRRAGLPSGPGAVGSYAYSSGETYVVVPLPVGGYEAFDDEDPGADSAILTAADLPQWTVDLTALARRFQEANGLTGNHESIDPRLWYLGEKEGEEERIAYLLALLDSGSSAVSLIGSLHIRLPARYHRIHVFCPSFTHTLE